MRVIGLVTSFTPLNGQGSGSHKEPLHNLSIEGFSCLVKPALVSLVPERGEVSALISVQWKAEKGKRPIFWLQDIKPVV